MRVLFACLADHADASAAGKLNVAGIFDRIGCRSFPARHGKMFFVFRLMAEFEDSGQAISITVRLRDEDSIAVREFKGTIMCPAVVPGEFTTFNQIFELNDTVFERAGRYTFAVQISDLPEVDVPFVIDQL